MVCREVGLSSSDPWVLLDEGTGQGQWRFLAGPSSGATSETWTSGGHGEIRVPSAGSSGSAEAGGSAPHGAEVGRCPELPGPGAAPWSSSPQRPFLQMVQTTVTVYRSESEGVDTATAPAQRSP